MIDTRESLLDRLKVEDAHAAWREFYQLYWGAIMRYAQKLGLTSHQAEEVLQETMVALMRILPEFAYDRRKGRFRNFLLTIVHRKSLAAMRRMRRGSRLLVATAVETEVVGTEKPPVDEEALQRWRQSLLEEALTRLRDCGEIETRSFAVFQSYVLENRNAADVAKMFGLQENAVYQIKNRLTRRLQAEVTRLMRTSGSE